MRYSLPAICALSLVLAVPAVAQPLDCVIEPRAIVDLAAPDGGIIADILTARGDRVAQGDPVVEMESAVQALQLDFAAARVGSDVEIRAADARLSASQRTLERATTLAARSAGTAAAVDEAQVEVDLAALALEQMRVQQSLAELEYKQAQALLTRRTIRTPIDGIVTTIDAAPGEYATEQTTILRIAQIDPLTVETFVPAGLYDTLAVGQRFAVAQVAPLDGRFEARVIAIDRVFDVASATFGVQLSIDNPDGLIPAGTRCLLDLGAQLPDAG